MILGRRYGGRAKHRLMYAVISNIIRPQPIDHQNRLFIQNLSLNVGKKQLFDLRTRNRRKINWEVQADGDRNI